MFNLVFVSNYLNHHQIPFCNAMYELLEGRFVFIQTEPMEQERLQMGWQKVSDCPYLKLYYEQEEDCRELILSADVVLYGGTDEECYLQPRLQAGKAVVRYSERLYRGGQWKAISPRGLKKKFLDHTRYRRKNVYLLCSGAYVPSDFHIVRAYPGKMFRWGYFTETKHYDLEQLMANKGYEKNGERVPYLLWAARLIALKHPELPLLAARKLKEKGIPFHLDIVGGGVMEDEVRRLQKELELEDCVNLVGFLTPEEVRARMEKADIFLLTSDRNEGWGAVANESMNSGCALVVNHRVGAAPYLVCQGKNGFVYPDGDNDMLCATVEKLVLDRELCQVVGKAAYKTITESWNAENAARELIKLIEAVVLKGAQPRKQPKHLEHQPPCAPAPVISERNMWREIQRCLDGGKHES